MKVKLFELAKATQWASIMFRNGATKLETVMVPAIQAEDFINEVKRIEHLTLIKVGAPRWRFPMA